MIDTTLDTIKNNKYMTLSTVCEDGLPYGTPVHFYYQDSFLYWFSFATTTHSKNIARNSNVFISIFDAVTMDGFNDKTGLYIKATAELLKDNDAVEARRIFADQLTNDKHVDQSISIYRASIGNLDQELSTDKRIYRK